MSLKVQLPSDRLLSEMEANQQSLTAALELTSAEATTLREQNAQLVRTIKIK
jgi:hypothetical protein